MASCFILHQTFVPDSLVFISLFYEVGTDISYWFLRIRHKKTFFQSNRVNQPNCGTQGAQRASASARRSQSLSYPWETHFFIFLEGGITSNLKCKSPIRNSLFSFWYNGGCLVRHLKLKVQILHEQFTVSFSRGGGWVRVIPNSKSKFFIITSPFHFLESRRKTGVWVKRRSTPFPWIYGEYAMCYKRKLWNVNCSLYLCQLLRSF